MAYLLSEINRRVTSDPAEYVAECDARYADNIKRAADAICKNLDKSPLVLLSGPSGSGKTTSSKRLSDELEQRGIKAHPVAMDNYFRALAPEIAPRAEDGDFDLESPMYLDMDLLNAHFDALERDEEILIPSFDFAKQCRAEGVVTPMRLGRDEVAIFEGIHALSDAIDGRHLDAFGLYISPATNIADDSGAVIYTGTWMRLARRSVRDMLFRGSPVSFTLNQWNTVLDGEVKYINPNIGKADFTIDTSFGYEVSLMKPFIAPEYEKIDSDNERYEEVKHILSVLKRFEVLDEKYVASDSILREFIGGGKYEY